MTEGGDLLNQLALALVSGAIKVIDLTQPLEPSTPVLQLPAEFVQKDRKSVV